MPKKVILFEWNEVPLRVIEHFKQNSGNDFFRHFLQKSHLIHTYTQDQGDLHPKVTWASVYRGVFNTLHQIEDFGEDLSKVDALYPPFWHILQRNGVRCGIFGSLHTYPLPADVQNYAFYVPDAMAAQADCFPTSIKAFQEFNLSMAHQSKRNVYGGLDFSKAFSFLQKSHVMGIQWQTLYEIFLHLLQERKKPHLRTRRRYFQFGLSFDIFMHLLRTRKPDFASFHTNHLAAALHRYWAAFFPEDYREYKVSSEWVTLYKEEIPFAMHKSIIMLEKLAFFIQKNPDYELWIAGSMGQAATQAEMLDNEIFMKKESIFFEKIGFKSLPIEALPAMHPQYNFKVPIINLLSIVENLEKIQIDGRKLSFRYKEDGFLSIDLGHRNVKNELLYEDKKYNLEEFGLQNIKIDDGSIGSAYHIPEGVMLIYPFDSSLSYPQEIQTTDIAKMLLLRYGIDLPSYLK